MPYVRSYYNYDRDQATRETGLDCSDAVDRAEQHHKEECDINTLIQRFGLGHVLPESLRLPQYGDFLHISNYHEALNQIAVARENFESLPANLRDRFSNDPGRFIDFALSPDNRAELESLGLVKRAVEPSVVVQATTPPPTPQKRLQGAPVDQETPSA